MGTTFSLSQLRPSTPSMHSQLQAKSALIYSIGGPSIDRLGDAIAWQPDACSALGPLFRQPCPGDMA